MAVKTEQFKSAGSFLGKTIGQSFSMISGKDVANYSLLFMDPTSDFKRGEHQMIFMPHIVLGRSSKCHVKYSDEYRTVSREHASITIDGSQFVLHHNPTASNPTYVNGRIISSAYSLQNGDEIQLSNNGPRIRFNVSTVKTSTIGITNRIGAAMAQAAKPYKRAITMLSVLLLTTAGISGYFLSMQNKQLGILGGQNKALSEFVDSLLLNSVNKDSFESEIEILREKLKRREDNQRSSMTINKPVQATITNDKLPEQDVFLITAEKIIFFKDGKKTTIKGGWTGTGFLTQDGYFITARHVVQPWRFFRDEESKLWSLFETRGVDLTIHFTAISNKGKSIHFTSKDMIFNDDTDMYEDLELELENKTIEFKAKSVSENSSDWAYFRTKGEKGECIINKEEAENLAMGEKLYILGFSHGYYVQSYVGENIKPLYSESNVAQNGTTNGIINTTNKGFASGNSGGPVFILRNGKYEVIGIVSASIGSELGIIVPISKIP